jgi:hypothetical protein
VLYEMLSGRRAFKGDSAVETMRAILKEEPAELTEVDVNVPLPIERIVRRCLAREAAFRPLPVGAGHCFRTGGPLRILGHTVPGAIECQGGAWARRTARLFRGGGIRCRPMRGHTLGRASPCS